MIGTREQFLPTLDTDRPGHLRARRGRRRRDRQDRGRDARHSGHLGRRHDGRTLTPPSRRVAVSGTGRTWCRSGTIRQWPGGFRL